MPITSEGAVEEIIANQHSCLMEGGDSTWPLYYNKTDLLGYGVAVLIIE